MGWIVDDHDVAHGVDMQCVRCGWKFVVTFERGRTAKPAEVRDFLREVLGYGEVLFKRRGENIR